MDRSAILETMLARCGMRGNLKVVPGLYCVGTPGKSSPALLTCNYKLTFDHLRSHLEGVDAWIVVLDTHGVNVWCSAGKGLFSTREAVARVRSCGLDKAATSAPLILPQLSATGVNGRELAKATGRKVLFGPVRARDIKEYLANGSKAAPSMRRVTFSMAERAVLTPVELFLLAKPLAIALLSLVIVSGFGPGFYSVSRALQRGGAVLAATILALFAGAVLMPLLLPWIPGRMFSLKGAIIGAITGLPPALLTGGGLVEKLALLLWSTAFASYLSMNFTGSTPFTSPSGVEKEMRRSLPFQAGAALIALVLWFVAAFLEV